MTNRWPWQYCNLPTFAPLFTHDCTLFPGALLPGDAAGRRPADVFVPNWSITLVVAAVPLMRDCCGLMVVSPFAACW